MSQFLFGGGIPIEPDEGDPPRLTVEDAVNVLISVLAENREQMGHGIQRVTVAPPGEPQLTIAFAFGLDAALLETALDDAAGHLGHEDEETFGGGDG